MSKIVVLAGGVGGAKIVKGLNEVIPHQELTVIVNTGDDFIHLGLNISPDLDTVMYTIAGLANELTGWGRKDETWNTFENLKRINSETWFNLGDSDIATHLERTRMLGQGLCLTDVTNSLCKIFGVDLQILPMTDQKVTTMIDTREYGEIPFQEYFVKYQYKPEFIGYSFKKIENAFLNPVAKNALEKAEVILISPSNPWISIFPILSVRGVKEIVKTKTCVAISPIIGNKALKGPAAKIFTEMGIVPSAFEVAKLYQDLISGFVLDRQNAGESESIRRCGIIPLVTDTVMKDDASKARLAREVCQFLSKLQRGIDL